MTRYIDPYAPQAPRVRRPAPQLPVYRLKRVGITQRAGEAYDRLWAELDTPGRAALADQLAILTDQTLADQNAAIDAMHDQGVREIVDWARNSPQRALCARLAAAVEAARPEPRKSLLEKLAALR